MIVDASAIVAIAVFEPGWEELAGRLDQVGEAYTHAVSIYEAALAIQRIKGGDLDTGRKAVDEFLARSEVKVVDLGLAETRAALDSFARYGKGRHAAKLNMGDCFSYGCARLRGMSLLYNGGDFALTDLA